MATPFPSRAPEIAPWRDALCKADHKEQLRDLGLSLCADYEARIESIRFAALKSVLGSFALLGAERVCLFRADPIDPRGGFRSPWVVSNGYALRGDHLGPDPALYQSLDVDRGYMQLAEKMQSDGSLRVDPRDNASPLLSGFYADEGVVDSLIVPVGGYGGAFYYYSVARYSRPFMPGQCSSLLAAAPLARGALELAV